MQINKAYQKIIPYGVEAKFTCNSKKGLKVVITRVFDSSFEADAWFKKRELYMQRAFQNLEVLCHNVKLLKKAK